MEWRIEDYEGTAQKIWRLGSLTELEFADLGDLIGWVISLPRVEEPFVSVTQVRARSLGPQLAFVCMGGRAYFSPDPGVATHAPLGTPFVIAFGIPGVLAVPHGSVVHGWTWLSLGELRPCTIENLGKTLYGSTWKIHKRGHAARAMTVHPGEDLLHWLSAFASAPVEKVRSLRTTGFRDFDGLAYVGKGGKTAVLEMRVPSEKVRDLWRHLHPPCRPLAVKTDSGTYLNLDPAAATRLSLPPPRP